MNELAYKMWRIIKRHSIFSVLVGVLVFFTTDYISFVKSEKILLDNLIAQYEDSQKDFEKSLHVFMDDPKPNQISQLKQKAFQVYQNVELVSKKSQSLRPFGTKYAENIFEVQANLALALTPTEAKPLYVSLKKYKISANRFQEELSKESSSYIKSLFRGVGG